MQDLSPVLDLEVPGDDPTAWTGIGMRAAATLAVAGLAQVQAATRRKPIVYTNKAVLYGCLGRCEFTQGLCTLVCPLYHCGRSGHPTGLGYLALLAILRSRQAERNRQQYRRRSRPVQRQPRRSEGIRRCL